MVRRCGLSPTYFIQIQQAGNLIFVACLLYFSLSNCLKKLFDKCDVLTMNALFTDSSENMDFVSIILRSYLYVICSFLPGLSQGCSAPGAFFRIHHLWQSAPSPCPSRLMHAIPPHRSRLLRSGSLFLRPTGLPG